MSNFLYKINKNHIFFYMKIDYTYLDFNSINI